MDENNWSERQKADTLQAKIFNKFLRETKGKQNQKTFKNEQLIKLCKCVDAWRPNTDGENSNFWTVSNLFLWKPFFFPKKIANYTPTKN